MKKKYSIPGNLRFILSRLWECDRLRTAFIFLRAPFTVATSILGICLSAAVVSAAADLASPQIIIRTVVLISILLILAGVSNKLMDAAIEKLMMMFDFKIQFEAFNLLNEKDYEDNESPSGLTRLAKAMECCGSDNKGARQISPLISSLAANTIGLISYAVILFRFNLWLPLAVTVTTLAGIWLLKLTSDWTYRNKDNWKAADRQIDYLLENAGDFTKAKDIRLYGMTQWFADIFNQTMDGRMRWAKKEQLYGFGVDWVRAVLSLFRDIVSYGLLVYLLFRNGMTSADFVLYFGIIGGFAGWLSGIIDNFSTLYSFHLNFTELREFMDYPVRANRDKGLPLPSETFSIEFINVSFRYENADHDTIHQLSFKIEKGEKLAIIGINGAGKTTLIKLMCGLYIPREGEVLIDGHPLNAYNREELFTLYSAVFQNIFLLPHSIARNITAGEYKNPDEDKLNRVVRLAGLYDKISALPEGLETRLVKSVHDDAIDLSGGEVQKLALARALYKDGLVLLLDEPTAALDPIAESRIYHTYHTMTQGRTSVFISHRLASTRFCDRIILFENGKIIEEGTHDSLMQKKGRYYEMYEIQSQYYREEDSAYDC